MKGVHKRWQDRRSGWTRRVRWYEGKPDDIRLKFEDADGSVSLFFTEQAQAQYCYDRFRRGDSTVQQLRSH